MTLPDAWPFPAQAHNPAPVTTKEKAMAAGKQVDSRKAGKPYKPDPGRKAPGGTTMVIKWEAFAKRIPSLRTQRIVASQEKAKYLEMVNAAAKEAGMLAEVVSAYMKTEGGKSFKDYQRKTDQLALALDTLPELDTTHAPPDDDDEDDDDETKGRGDAPNAAPLTDASASESKSPETPPAADAGNSSPPTRRRNKGAPEIGPVH